MKKIGYESLLDLLKKNNVDFFKFVLENSYFINEEIVIRDLEDISNNFSQADYPFSIRHSNKLNIRKEINDKKHLNTKKKILKYQKENNIYMDFNGKKTFIKVDSDGNKTLRDKIKKHTQYLISIGSTSDFRNYRISHIWDDTQNPILFSGLFNIIIIPTYLDEFVDKKNIIIDGIETNQFFKAVSYLTFLKKYNKKPATITTEAIEYAKKYAEFVRFLDPKPIS